ncbi:MAG: AMP-binding protein [Cytophagales bacterium]|nr:AMP-binding protein [Cytophagales bacterium]
MKKKTTSKGSKLKIEESLIHLFEKSTARFGDHIFLSEKKEGIYSGITYSEVEDQVRKLACRLLMLGIRKKDRVAILSENRTEWIIAELAVLYIGAISVPLSAKIEENSELHFKFSHSGCRFAFASGLQLPKIRRIRESLPDLETVIIFDRLHDLKEGELYIDDELSEGTSCNWKQELQMRRDQISGETIASICYTSGTTSDPKGIILTHKNFTTNVAQSAELMQSISDKDRTLLILPLDHSFSHTAGIYGIMAKGAMMAFPQVGPTPLDTLRSIPKNIQETKPTFLLSVPALSKSFRYNIERQIKLKGAKAESSFRKALQLAYKLNQDGKNRIRKGYWVERFKLSIYDQLIFKKIRKNFGGELKFFIGGGALLDIELQRFFYAIGMPVYQGYGLSEASPTIASNRPLDHKLGTSGKLISKLQLKIVDEQGKDLSKGKRGEILVKGGNVMKGYWQNQEATAECLKNGWLHTGDMGFMDEENYLHVLGRYKSLLVGNDGEKYAPEGIEESIEENSSFIKQILIYNSQNPYTVALILPDKHKIQEKLRDNNHSLYTEAGQKAAIKLIDKELEVYRSGKFAHLFPKRWIPYTFAVLNEGFTEQNRFLNSAMKIRRHMIISYYQNRLEELYTPEYMNAVNHRNMAILAKL